MQLDLGKLKVKNSFSWHGDKDSDPSAVHLDILLAKVCMNIFQSRQYLSNKCQLEF